MLLSSTLGEFSESLVMIAPGGGGELGAQVSEGRSVRERVAKQEFLKLPYYFTFGTKKMLAISVEHITGVAMPWVSSPLLDPRFDPRTPCSEFPKGGECETVLIQENSPPSFFLASPYCFLCTVNVSASLTHSGTSYKQCAEMHISTSLLDIHKDINLSPTCTSDSPVPV